MSVARALSVAPPPARAPKVSFEDYCTAEQKSPTRSEFIDGIVRPVSGWDERDMAGAGEKHIALTSILGEVVNPRLRTRGACRLRDQDTQIPISTYNVYTYPDAVIACPPKFATRPKGALLNPRVIFEVLSPSTEGYDRGDKFRYYRSLETLEEYVLISTSQPLVEVFPRSRQWAVQTYEGLESVAPLESVGVEIPLQELYVDVAFDAE